MAEQYKAEGDDAWKQKDARRAIDAWTLAIDNTDKSNKEFLKKLFSNRSAANAHLGSYSSALSDAEECCKLDQTWSRGYMRKGDALYFLKRYTEAYNAYNSGLRYAPNDKELMDRSERAMNAISGGSSSSSSSSSSSTSSSESSASASNSSSWMSAIGPYARAAVFVNALLYLQPFSRSMSHSGYLMFLVAALLSNLVTIVNKHGFPKFSMAYAAQVMPETAAARVMCCVIMFASRPYLLSMAPFLLQELVAYGPSLIDYGKKNLGSLQAQLVPLIGRFGPMIGIPSNMDPTQVIQQLLSPSYLNVFSAQMTRAGALCEVLHGIYLLIELILPSRNLLGTVMWWQYLQMRYMMDRSGDIKSAFYTVDVKIVSLLSHQMVPAVIRSYYSMLKSFLAKQVQPPSNSSSSSTSGGLSSMLGKCTVM